MPLAARIPVWNACNFTNFKCWRLRFNNHHGPCLQIEKIWCLLCNSSSAMVAIHHFIIGRSGRCFSYRFLFTFEISISITCTRSHCLPSTFSPWSDFNIIKLFAFLNCKIVTILCLLNSCWWLLALLLFLTWLFFPLALDFQEWRLLWKNHHVVLQ